MFKKIILLIIINIFCLQQSYGAGDTIILDKPYLTTIGILASPFITIFFPFITTSNKVDDIKKQKHQAIIRNAKDDALTFIATDQKYKTARLQAAFNELRKQYVSGESMTDKELAEIIIHY